MKILILLILAAAVAMPDAAINVNIKPRRVNEAPRRDTVEPRLTYAFDREKLEIRNVEWRDKFADSTKKYYGRINRVDADGYILQTVVCAPLKWQMMQLEIEHYGHYKINVFQEGDYCNGIEFKLSYFGRDANITPVGFFNAYQIPCN